MDNPNRKAFIELSSEDFERISIKILKEQTSNLNDVIIEHNKIIKTFDGNYQIDGYIEFTLMGTQFRAIIECKHYKSSISREKVQVLQGKIQSLGAHKGILISTANFQSGAIDYAKIHGIALIQLTEESTNYITRDIHFNSNTFGNRLSNYSQSMQYNGVLIEKSGDNSINCVYLNNSINALENFLTNI